MSFASLRRLRRRFGVSNAAKIAEARRYLHDELADRLGGARNASGTPSTAAALKDAGFDSAFGRDVQWAAALGDRLRTSAEPSDTEVDRFFDTVERLYGADLAEPVEPKDLVGRLVGGRYRVEALVGEGAAGVVYRARHVETDGPLAIKLLHPSKVLRREIIGELEHPRKFWDELVARFRREAKAAASVSHPGIVAVYDFGAEGAGFYQAMEYLEGENLRDVMAREAPMDPARSARLVYEAASALDAAHAKGVVHRDLKPANLFLCRFDWGETVKVLDFGIAKMVKDAEEAATRLTETGVFLGTYRYASPEQCLGEKVTTASDVYSLGVILFEMLAGRPPFDGPSSVLAIRHATARAPRVDDFRSGLPEGLGDVVDRALAKSPADRPSRGRELAAALEPFVDGRARVTTAALAPDAPPKPARRTIPADAFLAPQREERAPRARPAPPPATPTSHRGGTLSKGPRELAEMLVEDLKRQCAHKIADGLKTGDIYRRCRSEIEFHWTVYASRFPDDETDHFHELLVERVANGDASKLGPGMPDSTTQRRRRRKRSTPLT